MDFEEIIRTYEEVNPASTIIEVSGRMRKYSQMALLNPEYARIINFIRSRNYLINVSKYKEDIFSYLNSFMENYRTRVVGFHPDLSSHPSVYQVILKNLSELKLSTMVDNLNPDLAELSMYRIKIEDNLARSIFGKIPQHLESLLINNTFVGNNAFKILIDALPETLLSLKLEENDITNIDGDFSLPPRLEIFEFSANEVGSSGAKIIAQNLPNSLRELGMSSDDIDTEGVIELARHLPFNLAKLSLWGNEIEDKGAIVLSEIINPPRGMDDRTAMSRGYVKNLLFLNLGAGDIGSEGIKALARNLPPNLQYLDLEHNEIDAEGIKIMAQRLSPNLRYLDLSATDMDDDKLIFLAPYLSSNLEELVLIKTNISDKGIIGLAPYLPVNLRKLYLTGNNIGDVGMEALAPYLPVNLRELYLSENNIGDAGAIALAQNMPSNLEILHLSENNISDAGAIELSQYLSIPYLKILDLSKNNIADQGVLALARKIRPSSVTFYVGGPITEEGIRNIVNDPDVIIKKIWINYSRYIIRR